MANTSVNLRDLDARVQAAIDRFWKTRTLQSENQGAASGRRDAGARRDVTGGKHVDGFIELVRDLLLEYGVPETAIHWSRRVDLPGFFRAEKKWDLVVVLDGNLLACLEFKSQVGPSFGNNYNNRSEEAVGNAADIKTAYREGAFEPSPRPWIGYLMILEEVPASTAPVRVTESHFPVFGEFKGASYAERYEITLQRLLREEYYDATCFLLTTRGNSGNRWREPNKEVSFRRFAASLLGHAAAVLSADEGS